jgi:hypothetical protein
MNHYNEMIAAVKKQFNTGRYLSYEESRSLVLIVNQQLFLSISQSEDLFQTSFTPERAESAETELEINPEFKTFHEGNVEAIKGMVESFIE